MANRSYLFSSNGQFNDKNSLVLTGLSEWNYEIPLLYKLLFSGSNAVHCPSLIWDLEDPLAISISYEVAIDNLYCFKEAVSSIYSSETIKSAIQFLSKEGNRDEFLILEPYEIYLLNEEDCFKQQQDLLGELKSFDINKAAKDLIHSNTTHNKKAFTSIFKRSSIDYSHLENSLNGLGFNEWSNNLCYMPYPLKNKVTIPNYDFSKVVKFELLNLDTYARFRSIEIDRESKKVHLRGHKNRCEFTALLVDENRDVNERLNFRFNIEPKTRHDLMHVFSLMKGFGEEDIWRLSSSFLEKKNGEITLRAVESIEEYSFKENT